MDAIGDNPRLQFWQRRKPLVERRPAVDTRAAAQHCPTRKQRL